MRQKLLQVTPQDSPEEPAMRQMDRKQEGEPAEAEDAEDVAEAAGTKEEELQLVQTEPRL